MFIYNYSRSTTILLLFTVTYHVRSVAVHIIHYGYTKPWKIGGVMAGMPDLTMVYTACSVNRAIVTLVVEWLISSVCKHLALTFAVMGLCWTHCQSVLIYL